MSSKVIPSYGKPKGYGKKVNELARLHENEVVVQEKIDGSQISWVNLDGVLHVRSKGQTISKDNCPDGFRKSFDHLTRVHEEGKIPSGMYFRGEALKSPRHNHLKYGREPKGNTVIYDYAVTDESGISYPGPHRLNDKLKEFAELQEIDFAPVYAILPKQTVFTEEMFKEHYANQSVLLGPIEGVVLKNYSQVDTEGKTLMAKWVADEFREVEGKGPRSKGVPSVSPVYDLAVNYRTEARWRKAIQHLADDGLLTNSPKDIGPLVAEIKRDIEEEELDSIKDKLYDLYKKDLHRIWVDQFPQFYKAYLNE